MIKHVDELKDKILLHVDFPNAEFKYADRFGGYVYLRATLLNGNGYEVRIMSHSLVRSVNSLSGDWSIKDNSLAENGLSLEEYNTRSAEYEHDKQNLTAKQFYEKWIMHL